MSRKINFIIAHNIHDDNFSCVCYNEGNKNKVGKAGDVQIIKLQGSYKALMKKIKTHPDRNVYVDKCVENLFDDSGEFNSKNVVRRALSDGAELLYKKEYPLNSPETNGPWQENCEDFMNLGKHFMLSKVLDGVHIRCVNKHQDEEDEEESEDDSTIINKPLVQGSLLTSQDTKTTGISDSTSKDSYRAFITIRTKNKDGKYESTLTQIISKDNRGIAALEMLVKQFEKAENITHVRITGH